MNATHYLRVEGVNFGRFVYDTNHLSVIRGASLSLSNVIRDLDQNLRRQVQGWNIEVVSSGASSGLWALHATPDEADAIAKTVSDLLRGQEVLRHATVVVSIVPVSEHAGFQVNKETALAENRWQQMRASSVAVPAHNGESAVNTACRLDGIRPAVTDVERRVDDVPDITPASGATQKRHDYGRAQKQQFYKRETGIRPEFRFAEEFSQIASGIANHPLRDKLAVIFADGNGFSQVQQEHCVSPVRQKGYDRGLQAYRRRFLADFVRHLNDLSADPQGAGVGWLWRIPATLRRDEDTGDYRYRFETLIWGGDDLMWVMPAWQGWEFARRFFAHAETWRIGTHKLTQSMGMVFCNHHAPIARVIALARDLAEFAKDAPNGRSRNNLAYEVLESFDHLGTSVKTAWSRRCPANAQPAQLLFSGPAPNGANAGDLLSARFNAFATELHGLKFDADQEFPRSQLRRLVLAQARSNPAAVDASTEVRERFLELWAAAEVLERTLKLHDPAVDQANWELWTHLELLWDYAAPAPVEFPPEE